MTGNPKSDMASANTVQDKVGNKKRGIGIILCLVDQKNLLARKPACLTYRVHLTHNLKAASVMEAAVL